MRSGAAIVMAVGLAVAGFARAAPADHIKAAEAFIKATLGSDCDMNDRSDIPLNATDQDGVSHFAYSLSWHASWADGGDPPQTAELYQMFCTMGAYNIQYAFVLRDSNGFRLLSFARPNPHLDYADHDDAHMKAPPRVTGFASDLTLVNASFDPKSMTISSHANWRGLGDAWSAGQWRFADGDFQLVRFEIDPTYDAGDARPASPKSYLLYSADQ